MPGIRLDVLLLHVAVSLGLIVAVLSIQLAITKKPREQFVGWVAFPVGAGGFAVAGSVVVLLGLPWQGWLLLASTGGTFGLLSGLAVGRFVWRYYRKEIEGEE